MSRIGEKYLTKEGYSIEIVEKLDKSKYTIKFNDNNYLVKNLFFSKIKNGSIPNPEHKTVFGVGFIGIGRFSTSFNKKPLKIYQAWHSIMRRSYSDVFHKNNPSYINCSVDPCWHNFQNFAQWYEKNYIKEFELDKDILIKGNKIYGPDTCCFIPKEINMLFTLRSNNRGNCLLGVKLQKSGRYRSVISINSEIVNLGTFDTELEAFNVYKKRKEEIITLLAFKYKKQLTNSTFTALLNYKIEITD